MAGLAIRSNAQQCVSEPEMAGSTPSTQVSPTDEEKANQVGEDRQQPSRRRSARLPEVGEDKLIEKDNSHKTNETLKQPEEAKTL